MKQFIIKNFDKFQLRENHNFTKDASVVGSEEMQVSDGFHTMDELYEHRISLWIALCKFRSDVDSYDEFVFDDVWRSKRHSDGELAFGGTWFVLGIGMKKGEQMTYHIPIDRWDECAFAKELEKAPEFDGHTAADVLERLKKLST